MLQYTICNFRFLFLLGYRFVVYGYLELAIRTLIFWFCFSGCCFYVSWALLYDNSFSLIFSVSKLKSQ